MAKAFRMRQDTEDWFSKINKRELGIKTKFDLYYLCLMMGFASGRSSNPSKQCSDCTDFVDEFVQDYKPQQNLIIGLLIRAVLIDFGVSLDNKIDTKEIITELIDPNSITNLTNYGMESMNAYSSGGYDYLTENFDSKPYHLEEFLISYVQLLRQAVDQNPTWNSNLELQNLINLEE
ncbi:MAG TPA: hypothetical protein V6D21_21060 [Candidatus Obscuribacterales bacterium]